MSQMPPPQQPTAPVMRPHRGVLILVFSILSWVLCFIFGIVAWVMANGDLRAMNDGTMDPEGEGMTKAGKIVAMISVILNLVTIVVVGIFLLVGLFAAAATGAAGGGGP